MKKNTNDGQIARGIWDHLYGGRIYTAESSPKIEAFTNNGRVWIADTQDNSRWIRFDTPAEIDEFIAALQAAKQKAFEVESNDANRLGHTASDT